MNDRMTAELAIYGAPPHDALVSAIAHLETS